MALLNFSFLWKINIDIMFCVWVGWNVLCVVHEWDNLHCASSTHMYEWDTTWYRLLCVWVRLTLRLVYHPAPVPECSVSWSQKQKQQIKSLPSSERKGSRRADWEFIVMGSVNPTGLLLNVGWDTTWGSAFHPTPLSLLPVALLLSLVPHLLSLSLSHTHFYCLPLAQSVWEWAQSIISLNCNS